MTFHLKPVMDKPDLASLFYGPVLLAAEEPAPRTEWRSISLNPKSLRIKDSMRSLRKSITGDPKTLRFQIGDIHLQPFFETYSRYSVYFKMILE